MAAIEFGYSIAVRILQMRLHVGQSRQEEVALDLVDAGCEFMRQLAFKENYGKNA